MLLHGLHHVCEEPLALAHHAVLPHLVRDQGDEVCGEEHLLGRRGVLEVGRGDLEEADDTLEHVLVERLLVLEQLHNLLGRVVVHLGQVALGRAARVALDAVELGRERRDGARRLPALFVLGERVARLLSAEIAVPPSAPLGAVRGRRAEAGGVLDGAAGGHVEVGAIGARRRFGARVGVYLARELLAQRRELCAEGGDGG